jgi:hypothetical protein
MFILMPDSLFPVAWDCARLRKAESLLPILLLQSLQKPGRRQFFLCQDILPFIVGILSDQPVCLPVILK